MSVGQFFLLYDDETEQNRKEENENKEYQRKEEIKKTKVESATRLSILLSIGTSCGRYRAYMLLAYASFLFIFFLLAIKFFRMVMMMQNFYYLHTHHSHGKRCKHASDQRGENQDVNCDLLIHEYLLIEKTLTSKLLQINLHSIT